jgi:hypothetical protein
MAITRNQNSSYLTASGVAYEGPCLVKRIILHAGADTGATATLYDTAAADTLNQVTPTLVIDPAQVTGEATSTKAFELGIVCVNGCRIVLGSIGATATATVVFG